MEKAIQENDMLTVCDPTRRALDYGRRRGTFFLNVKVTYDV